MKVSSISQGKPPLWRRKLWDSRTLLLMCAPAIIFFIFFSYIPLPSSYIAFTRFNYNDGIFGSQFVGMENFKFLFTSGILWQLLRNTILYNLAFIIIGNVVQMAIAILLNEVGSHYFKKVTQSIMFFPYFISAVLVSLLVYNLINYDFGFLSNLVRQNGGEMAKLYSTPMAWPFIIVIVNLWQTTGYGSVVYFAAIMNIDVAVLEAARVDGANAFQRIWYITLPSLKPTFTILLLFAVGGIIRGNFGLFYNLVGNNSTLFSTTDIIETYVYRSMMNNFNFSQGSAVGLFQSVVGFGIVMGCNAIVKKIEPDNALF
ncbi:sugar ABC transporter permease [Spirochaetia bacterium]|nr:sugar ABC transporter permease [Spirochaetia bacterium]